MSKVIPVDVSDDDTAPIRPSAAAPRPIKDNWVGTADAKARYFLTKEDLSVFPSEHVRFIPGGIGAGPGSRWYRESALKRFARETLGAEVYEKKMAARAKREQNKRKRETDAAEAAHRIREGGVSAKKLTTAAERKLIEKLRKSLLRQCRKSLGHIDHSGHVGHWRIECPNVTAAQFAALIFRPEDPTLSTLVKSGAFYKVEMDPIKFFDIDESDDEGDIDGFGPGPRIRGIGGKYGSNDQIQVYPGSKVTVRYQPSSLTLSVNGESLV